MKVGVIGLGKMGSSLAARLSKQSFVVYCWSRGGGRRELESPGLHVLNEGKDVIDASDLILLSLSNDAAVRSVANSIFDRELNEKLIVDTSTVTPDSALVLEELIRSSGGRFLDAPITGSPVAVLKGQACSLVGGSENDFIKAEPVLRAYSRFVMHFGDVGSGQLAKVANNTMLGGYIHLLCQVMRFASKAGIDPGKLSTFLTHSPAGNGMIDHIDSYLHHPDGAVTVDLNTIAKDQKLFLDVVKRSGSEIQVLSEFAQSVYEEVDKGNGEKDIAELVKIAAYGSEQTKV